MSPNGDFSLVELFRDEVRSHGGTLSQGLLALEREPANPQRIEPLMRAAHSIKGAARIVGADAAVGLAHVVEDALVAAQQGRLLLVPADIDLLLRAADLLVALAEPAGEDFQVWADRHRADLATLVPALEGLARGQSTGEDRLKPGLQPGAEVGVPASAGLRTERAPEVVADMTSTAEVAPPAEPVVSPLPAESPEGVVRVTAGSLNRLMSLAGESLIQARWLHPFATSLTTLKKQQDRLASLLDGLAETLTGHPGAERIGVLLGEARRQSASCRQILNERMSEFEDHAARADDLNTRLYREVIVSRMRPFADGAHGFPRLVRDTARRLGKQVRLDIVGETTEVDRDVLEKLEAPLTHMLRNALDHGLETPAERQAAGKPEVGVIRIEALHRAGLLAITVADDGRGIDLERLRRKIVERNLASAEMVRDMSEGELLEFLFLPGFSTAATVTEYSGRGVGLDVVQNALRQVGGSVRLVTRAGQGTAFHLLLPITLSVLRAVLVEIAGEPYAFPQNRIDRLLRVPRAEVRSLEHRQFATVDGQNVGLVLASQVLDLWDGSPDPSHRDLPVVLLSDDSGQYGLIVDDFRGEQDLVVRPLDPRLGKVPSVSAAAILDDGSPVLIADVEDMIRSVDTFIQTGSLRRWESQKGETAGKRVLVVEDSITVRELERQLLRTHGYEVTVAVDGMDGWNTLRQGSFDLLITDVDMPRMTGLELVRLARQDPGLRDLPVIVVSYKDREEDRLRGLEVGANYYLTKSSFHDQTFLQAVVDLLGEG
jgi:two-component system sensor histidine kinase and response regulator WspE